ncbi:hypothetical protein DPMN_139606 [Dreissena polymorpha]|uniref:Uncharacterized protein n=1 Tax=Dreissena polymorpha TaxID=45954 RepID=A0A9D4G9U7_DREPO|nr:hypothetical protein DPMN_139606 [Dreissena polymorpha]
MWFLMSSRQVVPISDPLIAIAQNDVSSTRSAYRHEIPSSSWTLSLANVSAYRYYVPVHL